MNDRTRFLSHELNHLISNIIHNPVLKTSLVFAGFFCYNCRREKKGGTRLLTKMSFDELSVWTKALKRLILL